MATAPWGKISSICRHKVAAELNAGHGHRTTERYTQADRDSDADRHSRTEKDRETERE